jgi:uncharacterized membrane-anchored protein
MAPRESRERNPDSEKVSVMLALLLVLLLLILLFGGLGVYVAEAFFWALLVVLIVGLVAGVAGRGRFGRRV